MKKAKTRSRLSRRKGLELRREERSPRSMKGLHLKRYGMSDKSRRNFRYRVKHSSNKIRRRKDHSLTRKWS